MSYPEEFIDEYSKDFDYYYKKGNDYEFDFDYNNACNSYLDAYLAALKREDGRTFLAEDGIYRTIGYVDDPDIQKRFQDYIKSLSDATSSKSNPFVIPNTPQVSETNLNMPNSFDDDDIM